MPSDRAGRVYRFTYVLVLTIAVSAAFLYMISGFLIDLFLAAIFAGLLYPLFKRSLPIFGGRRTLAATMIVIAALIAVVVPLAAIATVVASEAVQLSGATAAYIGPIVDNPGQLVALLPDQIAQSEIFQRALTSLTAQTADIISALAGFLSRTLSSAALGAARTALDLFVIGFAMVSFLYSGPALVDQAVERSPVGKEEMRTITDKTLQITAATLNSIVIIGAAQGTLVGLGLAVAGIPQPWFWGTVAAAASTLPAIGAGFVWIPAAIYLMATGQVTMGIALAIWGVAVISTVDNLLRIYVVGRGAQMPSLLVFISTFGGIATFGVAGVLIGPVLAGLLFGVLDLYRTALKSTGLPSSAEDPAPPPAQTHSLSYLPGGFAANLEPRSHMRPSGSCQSFSVVCRWPSARATVWKSYFANFSAISV
jgi:predicted PurR-regulated permease PerM